MPNANYNWIKYFKIQLTCVWIWCEKFPLFAMLFPQNWHAKGLFRLSSFCSTNGIQTWLRRTLSLKYFKPHSGHSFGTMWRCSIFTWCSNIHWVTNFSEQFVHGMIVFFSVTLFVRLYFFLSGSVNSNSESSMSGLVRGWSSSLASFFGIMGLNFFLILLLPGGRPLFRFSIWVFKVFWALALVLDCFPVYCTVNFFRRFFASALSCRLFTRASEILPLRRMLGFHSKIY